MCFLHSFSFLFHTSVSIFGLYPIFSEMEILEGTESCNHRNPSYGRQYNDSFFLGINRNGENYFRRFPLFFLSFYHLVSTFIGILLTFSPMHFLGFNILPRRIPDFPDSFHSWNFLSSIGSGITFLSFAIFSY